VTKVLVFESEPAAAAELRRELSRLGATVRVVEGGDAGLELAGTDRPDLILLSIELRGENGYTICNRLKKHPQLKDVPLVVMSSEASGELFDQHRKLRTRADAYVHTPIAFGELLRRISPYLAPSASPYRTPGVVAAPGRTEPRLLALSPESWQRLETLAGELRAKQLVAIEPVELAALLLERDIAGLTEHEVEQIVRQRRDIA
jgi:DNA-binding response OmpR family regulator